LQKKLPDDYHGNVKLPDNYHGIVKLPDDYHGSDSEIAC
jgi:hypothetical protein